MTSDRRWTFRLDPERRKLVLRNPGILGPELQKDVVAGLNPVDLFFLGAAGLAILGAFAHHPPLEAFLVSGAYLAGLLLLPFLLLKQWWYRYELRLDSKRRRVSYKVKFLGVTRLKKHRRLDELTGVSSTEKRKLISQKSRSTYELQRLAVNAGQAKTFFTLNINEPGRTEVADVLRFFLRMEGGEAYAIPDRFRVSL